MPIYEYKCDACDLSWDEYRKLGNHDTACPECGEQGRHVFLPVLFKFRLAKHRRRPPRVGGDEVYSRTYEPGETVGDPMLDSGFEREG